ncbi:MAG TPA: DUF3306 domain-containing protein [Burkholderiales bacterium]|nr:DUF3306 domain-containing protein [Burkholderiales bacterium]
MAEDKEAFLSRWSRLKREQPAEPKAETAAPALPAVGDLTPESDFSGFMHSKVKDELRRVALKKLFTDPHFNIPDPFEAYSGDFTGGDPIPPEMLATLNQTRTILFTDEERKAADERDAEDAARVVQGEAKQDEPGRKDT